MNQLKVCEDLVLCPVWLESVSPCEQIDHRVLTRAAPPSVGTCHGGRDSSQPVAQEPSTCESQLASLAFHPTTGS
eukprot:4177569-Pyramimonas_sp.AAC.1